MTKTATVVNANKAWQRARVGLGAASVVAALLAAPSALADSAQPVVPPSDNTVQLAAAEPSDAAGLPALLPVGPAALAAVAAVAQPPAAVPHLPSLDNLPPGTTTEAPSQGRLDYLRYLWDAVRDHDVNMSTAALLLAQRPMSPNTKPPAGVSVFPSGPVGTSAPGAIAAPVPSDTP